MNWHFAVCATILAHGGRKQFDLDDPVDQIIVGCLCVALLMVVAIFVVAPSQMRKEQDEKEANDG
jgi:hypothetical protein